MSMGKYLLRSCPSGHMLVNSSDGDSTGTFSDAAQHCKMCLPGTEYINFPNTQVCIDCPIGGECDGSSVSGIPGSEWSLEASGFTRLVRCPAGHVLVRNDNPSLDQCVRCPAGRYLIEDAVYSPGPEQAYLVSSNAVSAIEVCLPCEEGLVCEGGNETYQKAGFWALPGTGTGPNAARRQEEAAGDAGNGTGGQEAARILVYQCNEEACKGNATCSYPCPNNFTCARGRYGPVCGLCRPGWVEAMGVCYFCTDDEVAAARATAWGIGVVLVLLLWVVISWRPLLIGVKIENETAQPKTIMDQLSKALGYNRNANAPEGTPKASPAKPMPGQPGGAKLTRRASMTQSRYGRSKLNRVFHSVATSSMKNTVRAMTGYGKIVIGFYQILSTLPLTFYKLDWTQSNDDVMDGSQVSRLDFLSLPSMACLMRDVTFHDKLIVYTVAPIIVSAMLVVPTLCVLVMGKLSSGKWSGHPKYTQVTNTYFWSQSFFMFLIYPTVSVMALSGIDCRLIGDGWVLSADVSEACTTEVGGPLFRLAVVAIILYPIGVPLFIFCVLWQQRVPHLARKKADRALVIAMINHYKLKTFSTEMEMLARFLGGHGANAPQGTSADSKLFASGTFKRRVGDLYDQQYGKGDGQKHWEVQDGGLLSKVHLTGKETRSEFEKKMAGVVTELHQFTGHETVDTLTKGQACVLIRHFETTEDDGDDLDTVELWQLKAMVMMCARSQARKGKIVVPPLQWNENDPEERKALRRVGNIFVAFKPEYWYYEVINTMHKLLMTAVLVFIFPGEYTQYAMGIAFIYFFLLITMRMQPFIISPLNNLQMYALVVLVITLFYGMMKNINDFQVSVESPYYGSGTPFTVFVAVLCATLPVAPVFWESVTTWMHHHNWFKGDKEEKHLKDLMHTHSNQKLKGGGSNHADKKTVQDHPVLDAHKAPNSEGVATPQHAAPSPAPYQAPYANGNANGNGNGNGNGTALNGNGTALTPATLEPNGHAAPTAIHGAPATPTWAQPPNGVPPVAPPLSTAYGGAPAVGPTPTRKPVLGKLKPLPGMMPNKVNPE